ncbi:hypothetical protein PAESOLCIP111_00364 [Paenibacillus solanacearum]|uniref:Uncharacterized protein n=1 Tax=Paenibacillus solanacearum TaxID=2048548 RepID=A0A916NUS9_9BACL|nr:hypothetical protein PAESOLCIP111_00364 [Paenibacillus solanacearum]
MHRTVERIVGMIHNIALINWTKAGDWENPPAFFIRSDARKPPTYCESKKSITMLENSSGRSTFDKWTTGNKTSLALGTVAASCSP